MYKLSFILHKKNQKSDFIRIICDSSTKPPELSSTKMHVFHEITLPFLTFIFPFLLFVKKSDEIIMKMIDFDNKNVVFIIFCKIKFHHYTILFVFFHLLRKFSNTKSNFLYTTNAFIVYWLKTLRFNRLNHFNQTK